jgi:hypothetical protein
VLAELHLGHGLAHPIALLHRHGVVARDTLHLLNSFRMVA